MRIVVLLLLLLPAFTCFSGGKNRHFERLTIEDGMSQNSVFYSLRDSRGFMWLGTLDGLNRYDGFEFRIYKHNPAQSDSISSNIIYSMVEDHNGDIWVATDNGLSRYDWVQDRFTVYRHDPSDSNSLSNSSVNALALDSQGRLWIATGNGLNRFDNGQFIHYFADLDKADRLSDNNVKALHFDNHGDLWLGTENGLNRFDVNSETFTRYFHDPEQSKSLAGNDINAVMQDSRGEMWIAFEGAGLSRWDVKRQAISHYKNLLGDENSLSHNNVKALYEDSNGDIWVGTDKGVSLLDVQSGQFKRFSHQNGNRFSLGSDFVRHIYDDKRGTIWVGTAGGAVNRYQVHRENFGHFNYSSNNPGSLSHNMVLNLHVDSKGILWVATRGGGLNYYDEQSGHFAQYRHDKDNPQSLSDDHVTFVLEDNEGYLWVGTGTAGLNRFTPDKKSIRHYRADSDSATALKSDHIRHIFQDKRGTLWFATTKGLSRYNKAQDNFTTFTHQDNDPRSISDDWVKSLFEDAEGNLWVTTLNGFNLFDRDKLSFKRYMPRTNDPISLSHGNVNFMMQDSRGDYWVGTYGGGLNQFFPQTGLFKHYRGPQGLPNDVIYGGLEDDQGYLWFSSNMGLFRYDSVAQVFKNYNANDGVQRNEFNRNAYHKSRDGELFFGGLNGFNRFYPHNIKQNPVPPQLAFTDFLLFNQSVAIGEVNDEEYTLPKTITSLDALTLDHTQSMVSFEFAAFDYVNPGKTRYAYQMQGLDSQWVYTDAKNRRATYTHLPPGQYSLKVKGSNADGIWNEQGISIDIEVLPPPWQTPWAYTLYGLLMVGLIFLLVTSRTAYSKARDQLVLNRELRHINKLKDAFLANTSHELRTPLNGIIGLAESMIDGAAGPMSEKARKNLMMVVASGKRLADLVDDILDFSKLKHGQLNLKTKSLDVATITNIVLTLLKPLTRNKSVLLNNRIEPGIVVQADENRLLQILLNLVGNGIKFTDNGEVSVSAKAEGERVNIRVSDSGIGIAPEHFDTIFADFAQVDGDSNRSYGGTGLGLSITRQLVQLHGGEITVESEVGKGSHFTFSLPVGKGSAANTMSVSSEQPVDERASEDFAEVQPEHVFTSEDGFDGSRFRLLIVDDEPINLQVLSNHLSLANYQLEHAHDGFEALQILNERGPFDLVLLDIMMPRMSGYQVCEKIREKWAVSDLPVIFLTAKNQVEDMVQGFTVGANDHLTKPVSKHELLSRVKTHLKLLDINRGLETQVNERTEQMVEAQKKLDLSEKLASLGGLMAGVAHEINNPTNFVHVSIQSLEHDLDKCQRFIFDLAGEEADEEILESFRQQFAPLHQHIDTIKDGTYRIKNIVSDLKSSTHLSDAEKKVVCITDMLNSTINLVATNYKEFAQIHTDFTDHPEVLCYPSKLNQVFVNLIVNAGDALKEKQQKHSDAGPGNIWVCCKELLRNEVKYIEITIKDNALGMDEQTRQRLFEPYYTTKEVGVGSGLGLSISMDIVKSHDGELSVQSVPGQGSEFRLLLPK